jgi:hypothetical protein
MDHAAEAIVFYGAGLGLELLAAYSPAGAGLAWARACHTLDGE